jgi:putative membrane protein
MQSARLASLTLRDILSDTPLRRIAVAVIVLVPLLYGALYLWAFWDPYGKLDRMPVALVNLDEPTTVDGKRIQGGEDLVRSLLDTHTVEWHMISAEEASAGLAEGHYYLSLTIPREFSANLGTANTPHPKRAELHVVARESSNMIASQVMSRVFAEIRASAAASATETYMDNVLVSFSDVRDGLDAGADGARELRDGLTDARDGAGSLAAGAGKLASGMGELESGLGTLAQGADDAAAGASRIAGASGSLASGVRSANRASTELASGAGALATGSAHLSAAIAALHVGSSRLATSAATLATGASGVSGGVESAGERLGEAAQGAGGLHGLSADVRSLLAAYAADHPEAAADSQFAKALAEARALEDGTSSLEHELADAQDGAKALGVGARQVADGAEGLASGAKSLSAGLAQANGGGSELASGARSLATGSSAFSAGLGRAARGASQLASGTATLASGGGVLAAGSHDALLGAEKIAAGSTRLSDGAHALEDGLPDAVDGAEELRSQLASGAAAIPSYDASVRSANSAMMANPVALSTTRSGEVPTYGTGFTPYFVPLALWVGALLAFFILKPLPDRAIASGANPVVCAVAGYLPGACLGVAQAIVLMTVVELALGLHPVHALATYGFAVLTGLVFIAILQSLNGAFGTIGRLISIVMLMLQLTSAGGTFPTQMIPGFFQLIHPFLPMTYVVDGMRQTISGGDLVAAGHAAAVLLAFGIVSLAISSFAAWRRESFTMERLHPSLVL